VADSEHLIAGAEGEQDLGAVGTREMMRIRKSYRGVEAWP